MDMDTGHMHIKNSTLINVASSFLCPKRHIVLFSSLYAVILMLHMLLKLDCQRLSLDLAMNVVSSSG